MLRIFCVNSKVLEVGELKQIMAYRNFQGIKGSCHDNHIYATVSQSGLISVLCKKSRNFPRE